MSVDPTSQLRQRHGWLGSSKSETGDLAPDRQRGGTSDAEPPMETSGDKENRTD